MNNNFNLKSFLAEGKLLKEIKVNRPKKNWNFDEYIPNFNPKDLQIGDTIEYTVDLRSSGMSLHNIKDPITHTVVRISDIEPSKQYPGTFIYTLWNDKYGSGATYTEDMLYNKNDKNKSGYEKPPIAQPDEDSFLPLTDEIKQEVDDAIASAIEDGEMEYLQNVSYWENDFEDTLLMNFGDQYPNAYSISDELSNYIQDKVYKV